jgi:hypothetical protein
MVDRVTRSEDRRPAGKRPARARPGADPREFHARAWNGQEPRVRLKRPRKDLQFDGMASEDGDLTQLVTGARARWIIGQATMG